MFYSHTKCVKDKDWALVNEVKWLFSGHFWSNLSVRSIFFDTDAAKGWLNQTSIQVKLVRKHAGQTLTSGPKMAIFLNEIASTQPKIYNE